MKLNQHALTMGVLLAALPTLRLHAQTTNASISSTEALRDSSAGRYGLATGTTLMSALPKAMPRPGTTTRPLRLVVDLPLLDLPFAYYASAVGEGTVVGSGQPQTLQPIRALANPSMEQSTQLSLSTRYALFAGTNYLFNRQPTDNRGRKLWKTGAELLLNTALDQALPFGQAWQHEEFHRAVMTRYGVSSNNTLNDWLTGEKNVNSGSVSGVNKVIDSNLARLKAISNPDFVRLAEAGGEAEIYGGQLMQQTHFFYHTGQLDGLVMLARFISPLLYIRLCADKTQVSDLVATALVREGSNQPQRDFTGPDFTAWAYDLYNPDMAYAARGQNPNGNGYDRYIYGNKLSTEQYDWIRKQSNLAWLNLLSPLNFFVNGFTLKRYANGEKLEANFAFRYYPTSFGNQLGLNVWLKKGRYNVFVNPALNQNLAHSFPSLEVGLVDYDVRSKLLLTVQGSVWTQPQDQLFRTADMTPGGRLLAKAAYKISRTVLPYCQFQYKSAGWVAGDAFLQSRFESKVGINLRF